ncbi:MAG: hypothetical protein M3Z67_03170 [Commensalibacter sp.]|nr:hypothetical protein [Commensalibacter sp.]
MRRQTAIFLGLGVLILATVIGIWVLTKPNLRPVTFPPVIEAEIYVGPQRIKRVLTPDEVKIVAEWIKNNQGGWTSLHKNPPSTGDAELRINQHIDPASYADKSEGQKPYPFMLTLWLGIHEADWNNQIFYEIPHGDVSQVVIKNCSDRDFQPLRTLVDQYPYENSPYP